MCGSELESRVDEVPFADALQYNRAPNPASQGSASELLRALWQPRFAASCAHSADLRRRGRDPDIPIPVSLYQQLHQRCLELATSCLDIGAARPRGWPCRPRCGDAISMGAR